MSYTSSVPTGFYRAEGMIKNVNTIEEYRNEDKNALLQQTARTVREDMWHSTEQGRARTDMFVFFCRYGTLSTMEQFILVHHCSLRSLSSPLQI